MSKVFISFLGTGDYEPCRYYYEENNNYSETKFIQRAILDKCFHAEEDSKLIICLTDFARRKHWDNETPSLKNEIVELLSSKDLSVEIKDLSIPDPVDEESIWKIFDTIQQEIPENAIISYDITHSFRSLPMLGIVLINYLKTTKNVELAGIYYGALEQLGTLKEVKSMPGEERYVPIIDLSSFDYMLEVSQASGDFINYGMAEPFQKVLNKQIMPILKESKGKDETAKNLRDLGNKTTTLVNTLNCCRGIDIYEGKVFTDVKDSLDIIRKSEAEFKYSAAFRLILDKIESKIDNFTSNNYSNGMTAVKWCIDNQLIQQAYTLLQENIITLFCDKYGFNYQIENERNFIGSVISLQNQKINYTELRTTLDKECEKVKGFWNDLSNDKYKNLKNTYEAITAYRNSFNHAGMKKDNNKTAVKIKNKIEDFYNDVNTEIEKLFKED